MGNPFGSGGGNSKNPDGVDTYPADEHDKQSYVDASVQLSQLRVPMMVRASHPNEKLFVAAFDGTGNDMVNGKPEDITNVGLMVKDIEAARKAGNEQISVAYVEGSGTQRNFFTRTLDGARGYTYEERIERMYEQFITQAAVWKKENPDADIRVASVGFSRGAEQAAGFTRLVEERGIQDPSGVRKARDENGDIQISYTKPPLVAPGQVAQAVGLYDPVGTGVPRDYDRRLPPSVISGFQITAEDERRNQFKSTNVIDSGFQENNRFLNVTVGGAHSDIGGSYQLDGLARRSGNLMTDYVNSLSDTPFLNKRAIPEDPAKTVVHKSEQHLFIYGTSAFEANGGRVRIDEVAPRSVARTGVDVTNKELHSEDLAKRFPERLVPIAPEPSNPNKLQSSLDPNKPDHPDNKLHMQSVHAVYRMDTQMGRVPDDASARMAASLTVLAKKEGLGIDLATLSQGSPNEKPGEKVFIVQGELGDPASRKACMSTLQAATTPVEKSFAQLDTMNVQPPKVIAQKLEEPAQSQEPRSKAITQ
jgi:Uncharacterized alpha/beta hydrolase domain (DUF2235)